MSTILRVRWTITPQRAPEPWLNCNRCGGPRRFESSGKARVNAQGKRLDAWLVYNCASCKNSWNRPIFERQNVRDVDPELLEALLTNDPDTVRRVAFDIEDLRRKADRIVEYPQAGIRKETLDAPAFPPGTLELQLAASFRASLRLDRLLASELRLPRARLEELAAAGVLEIATGGVRTLRRPVRDQTIVRITLSKLDGEIDLEVAAGRSAGPSGRP